MYIRKSNEVFYTKKWRNEEREEEREEGRRDLLGMNSRNSCMVDGLDGSMAAPKNSMMFGGAFLMRQANFRQM